MPPGRIIVDGDGTSYVAEIRRRSGLGSVLKWFMVAFLGVLLFLLGVRLGTDGNYLDAVESLERLVVGDSAGANSGIFAILRSLDATGNASLSRSATAERLVQIEAQCVKHGQKADRAWETYFLGLQTVVKTEMRKLSQASDAQVGMLSAAGKNSSAAEQQCSHVRALLDAILLQLALQPNTTSSNEQ
jgi:hypothetical protein